MPVTSIWIGLASLSFFFPAEALFQSADSDRSRDGGLPKTRYELPLPGKPVGVAAFSGVEGTLLVAAMRSPGGLALWDDVAEALEASGEPRMIALPDYLVGPIVIAAHGDTPARIAVASQATSELFFLTAEDLKAGAPTPQAALDLPGVPRFLCAGPNGSVYVFTRTNQIIYVGTDGFGRVTFSEHDQLCAAMMLEGATGPFDSGTLPMLIVGSQTDRVVAVYRADPEAKSGWKVLFDFEFEGIPRAFSTTDLDGDGDLELLIAGGDSQLWALGCGAPGGMNTWMEQETLQPVRHRLTSVPIALQGSLALSMSGQTVASLSALETHVVQREFDVYAGQSPVALAHADFNGDGAPDVVTANREARRVSLLLGEPKGAVRVPLRAAAGRGPSELSLVREGEAQSLIVLSSLDGQWSQIRRGADGKPERVLTAPAPAQTVALTAVHGAQAGKIGIAALSAPGSNSAVLTYASDLTAPNALTESVSARADCGASAGALLAMNLTGDETEELIVTDPAANRVRVFVVEGALLNQTADLELAPNPNAIAGGASNDFFVAAAGNTPNRGIAHLVWNDSSKALVEIDRVATPHGTPLSFVSPEPSVLCVLESRGPRDGAGTLCIYEKKQDAWSVRYESEAGFRPYAIAGSRELIVVSAQNSHHLNAWTRSGEEWKRRPDLGCGTGPLGVVMFDFDGDGILDIASANAFSDDVSVLLGR